MSLYHVYIADISITSLSCLLFSSVGLYGFKPSEDEDLNTSFNHTFEQLAVGVEEEMDIETRRERQITLVREWGRFLQAHAHGAAEGVLLRAVSTCFIAWALFL